MAETYKELQDEALQFLASAGEYALLESTRLGQEDKTSVNENKNQSKSQSLDLESSRYRQDESDKMSDGMVP